MAARPRSTNSASELRSPTPGRGRRTRRACRSRSRRRRPESRRRSSRRPRRNSDRVHRFVGANAEFVVEVAREPRGAREVPGVDEDVGRERVRSSCAGVLVPPPGSSVARSSTPSASSAVNSATDVASQRAAGSSRGRCARTPSGRRSRKSWKPMTCSTTSRAVHSVHGVGADHDPSGTACAIAREPGARPPMTLDHVVHADHSQSALNQRWTSARARR